MHLLLINLQNYRVKLCFLAVQSDDTLSCKSDIELKDLSKIRHGLFAPHDT